MKSLMALFRFSTLTMLVLYVLSFNHLKAQIGDTTYYVSPYTEQSMVTQKGGRYLTSKDTLNILTVFVQFPDDNFDVNNSVWPKNSPPSYMNTFFDSLASQNSQTGNMTHYFRTMSMNSIVITGKSRFITTPHTREWYLNNSWKRWLINKEVLETLDNQLDFAQFDRWTRNGEYSITKGADGKVDLILMLYRNVSLDLSNPSGTLSSLDFYGGEATLGYKSGSEPSEFYVDNGQRRIGYGWPGYGHPGSGTTCVVSQSSSADLGLGYPPYRVQIHELVHHWFGDNSYHSGAGFWAMLNAYERRLNSVGQSPANSYERERLGWHYPDSIYATVGIYNNLSLTDYLTTNKSYKIRIPNGQAYEVYRLEYHAKLSQFDATDQTNNSVTGLYILHQFGDGTLPDNTIRLIPADGKWKWLVNEEACPSYFPNGLAVFKYNYPDPVNGYDDCYKITFTWTGTTLCGPDGQPPSSPQFMYFHRDYATNQLIDYPVFRGDGYDHFNLSNNNIFSPWSNPRTLTYSKQATGVAIEVVNEYNGVLIFNLYVGESNAVLAAPSKPFLSYVGRNTPGSNRVRITWYKSLEPDISCYEIWRGWSNSPSVLPTTWHLKETVTDTSYIEDEFTIGNGSNGYAHYKIKAKDTQSKYSVFSNSLSVGIGIQLPKDNLAENLLPIDFDLKQNYPNPFNPSTSIQFALPVSENVNLRIYNILGQEIRLLINEKKNAGYHSVIWDGKDNFGNSVSSGIYLYRIETKNFIKTFKMLLVK